MQRSDTQALKNLQTIKNPVQLAREQQGYTQELLAAVAEVSRVLIVHVEQGLVKRVPKKIDRILDEPGLENKFQWWVTDTRQKNYPHLERRLDKFIDPGCSEYGDWLGLRRGISWSKAGMCKLYCIHPQILANFEKGIERRIEFTRGMRLVLLGCGISLEVLKNMEFAMSRRVKYSGNE
jgi:transcriptional regulator with XRE-family HTH domain